MDNEKNHMDEILKSLHDNVKEPGKSDVFHESVRAAMKIMEVTQDLTTKPEIMRLVDTQARFLNRLKALTLAGGSDIPVVGICGEHQGRAIWF